MDVQYQRCVGDVAALIRSHMNGLLPFESTIEQTTETMPPSPQPKSNNSFCDDDKYNYKITRAATLLEDVRMVIVLLACFIIFTYVQLRDNQDF